mmetsp:Transcript_8136/g.10085  ORF Transcript_8136/g.10085 Transcript_8136/m.10085 type:complete len:127 (+) Transcript_8136:230-610(+)
MVNHRVVQVIDEDTGMIHHQMMKTPMLDQNEDRVMTEDTEGITSVHLNGGEIHTGMKEIRADPPVIAMIVAAMTLKVSMPKTIQGLKSGHQNMTADQIIEDETNEEEITDETTAGDIKIQEIAAHC